HPVVLHRPDEVEPVAPDEPGRAPLPEPHLDRVAVESAHVPCSLMASIATRGKAGGRGNDSNGFEHTFQSRSNASRRAAPRRPPPRAGGGRRGAPGAGSAPVFTFDAAERGPSDARRSRSGSAGPTTAASGHHGNNGENLAVVADGKTARGQENKCTRSWSRRTVIPRSSTTPSVPTRSPAPARWSSTWRRAASTSSTSTTGRAATRSRSPSSRDRRAPAR